MTRTAVLLTAAAALLAAPASAQPQPCLTASEAESLALVALPEIIAETGQVCAARLPATSLIRRPGPLLAKYQLAADRAWPTAQGAIAKLSDPAAMLLLQSSYARPVLTSLIAPLIVGRVALADCGTIDRLVTQLEPLPPRNTANVIVTVLQYLKADKARGGKASVPDLPLCPAP